LRLRYGIADKRHRVSIGWRLLLGTTTGAIGWVLFLRHIGLRQLVDILSRQGADLAGVPQDFQVYLRAVQRYVAGQTPYIKEEYLAYKYSPAFLIALLALPRAPVFAWLIYKLLSVCALLASLFVSGKAAKFRPLSLVGGTRLFGSRALL